MGGGHLPQEHSHDPSSVLSAFLSWHPSHRSAIVVLPDCLSHHTEHSEDMDHVFPSIVPWIEPRPLGTISTKQAILDLTQTVPWYNYFLVLMQEREGDREKEEI